MSIMYSKQCSARTFDKSRILSSQAISYLNVPCRITIFLLLPNNPPLPLPVTKFLFTCLLLDRNASPFFIPSGGL